ncbi:hypothetical protein FRX31_008100 [Thalictrum thalictroides]|uniref:Uncharacterized protein n=1 Tax=Thalictrum thalictroides TaxID=46969 RepID=A0A7J6WY09_THATH|nr:hypothetical protein FRX31_008100 [Thalictrum thalictroides]
MLASIPSTSVISNVNDKLTLLVVLEYLLHFVVCLDSEHYNLQGALSNVGITPVSPTLDALDYYSDPRHL